MLTPSTLWTKNVPAPGQTRTSTHNFGQYWQGATNRLDLTVGLGAFGVEGQYQANLHFGGCFFM